MKDKVEPSASVGNKPYETPIDRVRGLLSPVSNFFAMVVMDDTFIHIKQNEYFISAAESYKNAVKIIKDDAQWQQSNSQQGVIELLEKILKSSYVKISNDDLRQEIRDILTQLNSKNRNYEN